MDLIRGAIVLLVLLMPGAFADVDYSYSSGNGASESSGEYNIGGAATVSLELAPEDSAAKNAIFASGPITTSRTANSGDGRSHAQSYFSVTGPSAKTIYEFTSSAAANSAQTTESLTSYDADTIYASGTAWNNNNDYALAYLRVTSPTDDKAALLDYKNNAYAYRGTTSYARVTQGCAWADVQDYTSGRITTYLYAREGGNDYSSIYLNLPWGTINYPYPRSPYNNAIAYASRTDNSGLGRTYAYHSINAYGRSGGAGGYYAQSTAKPVNYAQKQDTDYYATGTRTISQYAWTTYPNYNAFNS